MKRKDLEELAHYLIGYADGIKNEKIRKAGELLRSLSPWICCHGFACNGGDNCTSDHN